tara:strand:- start:2796 stop:3149 length:354 start_codon:yes stop_codon:yes gene_type:complete
MANPNIAAANSILGNTGVATLTASLVTLFTVPSSTVYKMNSITVANKSASAATVDLTVSVDGTNDFYLGKTINVPDTTTLVFLTKDQAIYVPETGKMKALASAGTALDIVYSYEAIS